MSTCGPCGEGEGGRDPGNRGKDQQATGMERATDLTHLLGYVHTRPSNLNFALQYQELSSIFMFESTSTCPVKKSFD